MQTQPSKSRPILPKVSLRALLLLVVPLSAILAFYASRYHADRTATARLVEKCPAARVIWSDPLGEQLGMRTMFARVDRIVIEGDSINDKTLLKLPFEEFRNLAELELDCPLTTDDGIDELSGRIPDVEIWTIVLERELAEEFTKPIPRHGVS